MKKETAKILAWSLEWEGSIMLILSYPNDRKVRLIPEICINNTSKKRLEIFRNLIDLGTVTQNMKSNKTYLWYVRSLNPLEDLLKAVIPFLNVKKRQGELLLEYCQLQKKKWRYSQRSFDIREEIHRLNSSIGNH